MLLKDLSIVHLFFTLWGVNRIHRFSLGEIFIRNLFFAKLLEVVDPVQADTLALHRLRAPKHGIRDVAIEEGTKCVFFRLRFAFDGFIFRIDFHDGVDDSGIQKRHSSFQTVRHGHAIGTLAVDIVQVSKDTTEFVVDVLGARRVSKIEITGEEFVGTFSGENHLDVLGSELGQKVVRDGRTNQFRFVRFEMVNHVFNVRARLFRGEEVLVVLRSEELGHHACGGDIRRTFLTNREGEVFLTALFEERLQHGGNNGRIETTRKEKTDRDIRHRLVQDGFLENGANVRRVLGAHRVVEIPSRVVPLNETFLRRPVVTCREFLDAFAVLVHDGLELGGEPHDAVFAVADVQRLDTGVIAGGDHVIAVITDDDETKNTVEFLHKLRSEMLVQLQQHLRVAPGFRCG